MPKDFNLGLVFLSYLVAVTASHVTLLLAARVRDPHATNWKLWVVSGGFAMGIGIWSMHFVATLALSLPIQVAYDLSLTALSWVFAIVACSAAFIVLRRLTGKHREFLVPGALIGIGIASMHYTGDASMRLFPAIRYDPLLFVASILIAIGAATAALWIAFHLAKQRAVFTNFGAALVMGAAVVGMHFTAVAAAEFHPSAICLASGPRLDGEWMAYTIGGFTFVILTATMLLSAYDARLSSAIADGAARLRQANERLEQRVRERTEELHRSRDAARAGSEAKSAFVATMSHEIRTPLNAVIGMLELFSYSRLSADQREMLSVARESSRSLLALIDDILDFSKIEVGKLEIHRRPCAVARVVDGVQATFEHAASGKGILLTRRIDPELGPAHLVDPSRLRQILANLVSNAIKFTHEGSVTLEVAVLEAAEGRQKLCFSVRDTGIGMSAETRRRLFEPFQQGESETSRRYGGTGLGLAICRQLIELMGGTIEVTSTEGLGTRVSVTLAAEQASAAAIRDDVQAVASERAPLPLSAPAGTKLLIVDDHPVNLAMLKRQLKVLGLEADTAASGAEALGKWRRERHDIVLTDLQMPEMDGYAVARAIRAEQGSGKAPRPTVIALRPTRRARRSNAASTPGSTTFSPSPRSSSRCARSSRSGWAATRACVPRPARPRLPRPARARSTAPASSSWPAGRRASPKCWPSSSRACAPTSPRCRSRSRARTPTRCGAPRIASREAPSPSAPRGLPRTPRACWMRPPGSTCRSSRRARRRSWKSSSAFSCRRAGSAAPPASSGPARRADRQAVDAAHFIVPQDGAVAQKSPGELQRIGAPEHLAVDHEARHAEYAARRRVFRAPAQRVLLLRQRFRPHAELAAERGEARLIARILAVHPQRVENPFDRLGPASAS
jgi:signal transduction histidine kinase